MTVPNTSNRTSAIGAGAVLVIPYLFPTTASGDLKVIQRLISTGAETVLVENAASDGYTATYSNTGGIVTTSDSIAVTSQVHVIRSTSSTQSLDLEHGGSYSAERIEAGFDKTTKLTIQNKDQLDYKVIKIPETDSIGLTTELESSKGRASKVVGCDSDGNFTMLEAIPEGSVSFSTFGTSMAEATNAEAGKAVLNLDNVFDPTDSTYGAVGNGIADDTDAMDACYLAAATAGGKMIIPPGTYLVTTWTMTGPCVVEGQSDTNATGGGVKIKSVSAGVPAIHMLVGAGSFTELRNFEIATTGNSCAIEMDEAHNEVLLSRIQFDGQDSSTDVAVLVEGGNYLLMEQCSSFGYNETHIKNTGCSNIYINDHTFDLRNGTAPSFILDTRASGGTWWINNLFAEWAAGAIDLILLDNATSGSQVYINGMFVNVGVTPRSYVHQTGAGSIEPIIIKSVRTGYTPTSVILNDDAAPGHQVVVAPTHNSSPGDVIYYTPLTVSNERIITPTIAAYGNDTTPSMKYSNIFSVTPTTGPIITDFDDGVQGQTVTGIFLANGAIVDFSSGNLIGNNGANWRPKMGDSMTAFYNGTNWYCSVSGGLNSGNTVCNVNGVLCNVNQVVTN